MQIAAIQAVQSRIHQLLAALSGEFQEAHDRVPVESSEPFCAADGTTFNKAMNSADRSIFARAHRAKRGLRLRFAKGCRAGIAAPALNSALTEVPKTFAGVVLAFEAGHDFSPLAFCGEKPENKFDGLMFGLTPECRISPAYGSNRKRGSFFSYVLGWWLDRDLYGLTVAFDAVMRRGTAVRY